MKRKGCREVDGVIEIRSGCMLLQLLRQPGLLQQNQELREGQKSTGLLEENGVTGKYPRQRKNKEKL